MLTHVFANALYMIDIIVHIYSKFLKSRWKPQHFFLVCLSLIRMSRPNVTKTPSLFADPSKEGYNCNKTWLLLPNYYRTDVLRPSTFRWFGGLLSLLITAQVSHNIDELSEGGPSLNIPDWWFVFQRVTSDGKSSGIYHSQKVRGSFKIGNCHRGYSWMG